MTWRLWVLLIPILLIAAVMEFWYLLNGNKETRGVTKLLETLDEMLEWATDAD